MGSLLGALVPTADDPLSVNWLRALRRLVSTSTVEFGMGSPGSLNRSANEPAFPFYLGIMFDLLPEVDRGALAETGHLATANGREQLYVPFAQALQKAQWARLAGLRAVNINHAVAEQYEEGVLVHDWVAQIGHERSVTEFVMHVKASLDAAAVFLTGSLTLEAGGGNRDFKWSGFRRKVGDKSARIQAVLAHLAPWLASQSTSTGSIVAARDAWIHQTTPGTTLIWPPADIGALPVPKTTLPNPNLSSGPLHTRYWSTQRFVEHHLERLLRLLSAVLDESLAKERSLSPGIEANIGPESLENAFPMHASKDVEVRKIRIGRMTAATFRQTKDRQ